MCWSGVSKVTSLDVTFNVINREALWERHHQSQEKMRNLVARKVAAQSHDKEKLFLLVLIMQGSL